VWLVLPLVGDKRKRRDAHGSGMRASLVDGVYGRPKQI
jgi:hypothetical protein